jgi:hypothetical protein
MTAKERAHGGVNIPRALSQSIAKPRASASAGAGNFRESTVAELR